MQERISGIYVIENILNGKVYVGSSVHIKRRTTIHRSCLRGGYHGNEHLQRAWTKYGESAFEFRIVQHCPEEDLTTTEQYWLDKLSSEAEVYNVAIATDSSMRGRKMPESGRQKISAALTGHKRTKRECEIIRERMAKDYPEFIHESGQIIPAGRNLAALCRNNKGLRQNSMWRVVHGTLKSHHGWMLHKRAIKQSDGSWSVAKRTRAESYPAFIHTTGKIIPAGFDLAKLCRERELNRADMCSVKTGKIPTSQGWMLKNRARQSADGTWFIEHGLAGAYPSFTHKDGRTIPAGINISRMCREYNLGVMHIIQVMRGERKSHKGWRLLDE